MIFVEVEVQCDTYGCGARTKSLANYGRGDVRVPLDWTFIVMQRMEHHCPKHGAQAVDGYKRAAPAFASSLRYEVGKETS